LIVLVTVYNNKRALENTAGAGDWAQKRAGSRMDVCSVGKLSFSTAAPYTGSAVFIGRVVPSL